MTFRGFRRCDAWYLQWDATRLSEVQFGLFLLYRNHNDIIEEAKSVEPEPAYLLEPIPDDETQINELLQKESIRSNPSQFAY